MQKHIKARKIKAAEIHPQSTSTPDKAFMLAILERADRALPVSDI
jgi:hypothetical protein